MRRDTVLRKMPKKVIRRESFYDSCPIRKASIFDRMSANEEITNASIRQAQRKSSDSRKKSEKVIDEAFGLVQTFSDHVSKINKEA